MSDLPSLREEDYATSCGGFMTLGRLAELERDPRYRAAYAVAHQGERVLAIVPLYAPQVPQVPDPAYDPARFVGAGPAADATRWLFAGGRADLSCGFLVHTGLDPETRDEATAATRAAAHALARRERRRLVAFYARDRDLPLWSTFLGDYDLKPIDRHAELAVVGDGAADYVAALPSSHRGIVRRDWRDRDRHGLRSRVERWEDVLDDSAPLVANVKARYGQPDHPRLIRMRLEQWLAGEELSPVAFRVEGPDGAPVAISLGWRWRAWLQLYEVGLVPEGAPGRHAAYVEALIYAPLRFAASSGCALLTLGLGSTEPKRLRGATLEPVYAIAQRTAR